MGRKERRNEISTEEKETITKDNKLYVRVTMIIETVVLNKFE